MRSQRLVLLGDPVHHSLSPMLHQAALARAGIPGSYEARPVDASGMEEAAEEIRRGDLTGANITMPHKHLAYRLADEVDLDAQRAGSVNTWVADTGILAGYSSDVEGVRRVWTRRTLPGDAPVLILGSGGAAAAALVALDGREVVVSARSPEAAVEMIERCDVDATVVPWGHVTRDAVIVNCTPLGMHREELPPGLLDDAVGLLDMAYGPEPTPSVVTARSAGLRVCDGIDLLVAQAEVSFRIWTGREPEEGLMEQVARNASSGP